MRKHHRRIRLHPVPLSLERLQPLFQFLVDSQVLVAKGLKRSGTELGVVSHGDVEVNQQLGNVLELLSDEL
jgi:hypothetical protein